MVSVPRALWLIFLVLALTAPGRGVCADEVLKVGTYRHYPPWTIAGDDGALRGFEPAMVSDLCRRMAVRCEMSAVPWESVFDDLDAGKYDVYIGGMAVTAERARRVAFTMPYGLETDSFATVAGHPLTSVLSLNTIDLDHPTGETQTSLKELVEAMRGQRIGVHVGTTNEQLVDSILSGVADIRRYTVEQQQYDDLVDGKLDAVFAASSSIYYFAFQHKELSHPPVLFGPVLNGSLLSSGVGGALRRGNTALLERLNTAIAAAKDDGTLARLSFLWFGANVTSP